MDKKKVVAEIQNYLAQELSDLAPALENPEKLQSQEKEDLAARVDDIKKQLLMYKFLPVRPFTSEDVICPGGLVELEINQMRAYYLVVPAGGGLVTRVDGKAIQVITPNSPLGEALLGKKVGDEAEVTVGGKPRHYKVVGYF